MEYGRQLAIVRDFRSPWEECLKGDPVRPHIPAWARVGANREYFLLHRDMHVLAVTCVAYGDNIPKTEEDIFGEKGGYFYPTMMDTVCFYTVWSNEKGCGRLVLNLALNHIRHTMPRIQYAYTLSPKSEAVRKFHLSNAARLFRENELTDNYSYDIR